QTCSQAHRNQKGSPRIKCEHRAVNSIFFAATSCTDGHAADQLEHREYHGCACNSLERYPKSSVAVDLRHHPSTLIALSSGVRVLVPTVGAYFRHLRFPVCHGRLPSRQPTPRTPQSPCLQLKDYCLSKQPERQRHGIDGHVPAPSPQRSADGPAVKLLRRPQ